MAEAPITLVVNADDFGLSSGANRAIESACRRGILRSTSLMPNGSAFDNALETASRTPELGVGIHLSLVDELCVAPIKDVRGLVDGDGRLPASYASFAKAYALRRFGLTEIRTEIEAQVRRVLDTGLVPTHIDSHQHLHIIPGVFEVVLTAAKSAGISVIRIPCERGGVDPNGLSGRGVQLKVLSLLAHLSKSKAHSAGMRFADHFWGLGVSGRMDESNLTETIKRLRPGVNEIMCHPAISDPSMSARYQWDYHWDDEASALESEAVRRIVEDRGARLANFRDAWERHESKGMRHE